MNPVRNPDMSTSSLENKVPHVNVLQIGAHVGHSVNDPLFHTDLKNQTLVVIEPVPFLFQQLVANYKAKEASNYILCLNVAMSNTDGTLKLYVPSPQNDFSQFPFWASQLASTNPTHISTHLPTLKTDEVEVPCYRLNTLIKNLGIQWLDTLMVDTEGHDYEILMDLDLSLVKPKRIRFENKHMDGIFTRGGKYNALLDHFAANGYVKVSEDHEDTLLALRL
jgi:FkbM family methyltransferase